MTTYNNDTNNQTAYGADEIVALAVGTITSSFISIVIGITVCVAMYRSTKKLKVSSSKKEKPNGNKQMLQVPYSDSHDLLPLNLLLNNHDRVNSTNS